MPVHVIGAGLAGLASAVRLVEGGVRVALHEAAPQAGGRCRSYHDKTLGRMVDNGNHLMLSGNRSLFAYLEALGAEAGLVGPSEARFPFLDLKTGERWTVRIDGGRWTTWLNDPTRGVPGARLRGRIGGLRLAFAGEDETVAACLRGTGVLWPRFWEPMAVAVLNTPPERASARLLWTAMRESFAKGGKDCRPLVAKDSLAASLVDPALAFLKRHRASVHFGRRLRSIDLTERTEALHFTGLDLALAPDDHVVLALPPAQIAELLPGVRTPNGAHAIVNAHFRLPAPARIPGESCLLGLVGGEAQWLFLRDEIASVTVSAADELAEAPAEAIAGRLWADVAVALGQPAQPVPAHRIVKEKRATFSQTPTEIAERPPTRTRWPDLHLAGDWTDTGLPATIEGAVRSGHEAAAAVLESLKRERVAA